MNIFTLIYALVLIVTGENTTNNDLSLLQPTPNYAFEWKKLIINRKSENSPDFGTVALFLSGIIKEFPGKVFLLCDNQDYTSQIIQMSRKLQGNMVIYDKVMKNINFKNIEEEVDDKLLYLIFMDYTKYSVSKLTSSIRLQQAHGDILIVTDTIDKDMKQELSSSQYYQIFLATPTKSGYQLYEKCAYCHNGGNIMLSINSWSPLTGFEKPLLFRMSFKGTFNGRTINVSLPDPGFNGTLSNEVVVHFGKEYDMLHDVAELLNFSIVVIPPKDGEWGRYKDNKWTGMVGLIHEGVVDIALGVISITKSRYSVINPTALIEMEEIGIISAKPSREPRWQSIFECFSISVWGLTVVSVVLVGLSVYIINHFSEVDNKFPFTRAFYISVVVLCSEPFSLHKPNSYTIFVLSLWLLMSTLILSFYTGSLTSLILAPPFSEKPIDSPEDLLRSGRKWMSSVGTTDSAALNAYPELIGMFQPLKNDILSHCKYGIMNKMLHNPDDLTWVTDTITFQALHYFLDPIGLNPTYIGKNILSSYPNSWMVNKYCPYEEDLTLAIMRMQEVGLQLYYQRKMFLQVRVETIEIGKQNNKRSSTSITLADFIKMTMVLLFVYLLSPVVFLIERFVPSHVFSFHCNIINSKLHQTESKTNTTAGTEMENGAEHGIKIFETDYS